MVRLIRLRDGFAPVLTTLRQRQMPRDVTPRTVGQSPVVGEGYITLIGQICREVVVPTAPNAVLHSRSTRHMVIILRPTAAPAARFTERFANVNGARLRDLIGGHGPER